MHEVVCYCGLRFVFTGDLGYCPNCDEPVTMTPVSAKEEAEMRAELTRFMEEMESEDEQA